MTAASMAEAIDQKKVPPMLREISSPVTAGHRKIEHQHYAGELHRERDHKPERESTRADSRSFTR